MKRPHFKAKKQLKKKDVLKIVGIELACALVAIGLAYAINGTGKIFNVCLSITSCMLSATITTLIYRFFNVRDFNALYAEYKKALQSIKRKEAQIDKLNEYEGYGEQFEELNETINIQNDTIDQLVEIKKIFKEWYIPCGNNVITTDSLSLVTFLWELGNNLRAYYLEKFDPYKYRVDTIYKKVFDELSPDTNRRLEEIKQNNNGNLEWYDADLSDALISFQGELDKKISKLKQTTSQSSTGRVRTLDTPKQIQKKNEKGENEL